MTRRISGRFRWVVLCLAVLLPVASVHGEDDPGCSRIDVYVAEGCPHCADAKMFLDRYRASRPELEVFYFDVRESAVYRQRFLALAEAAGVARPGVPAFSICGQFYVGFSTGESMRPLFDAALRYQYTGADEDSIRLPVFGRVGLESQGLLLFTIAVGLVDGFNPCAMWVLLFLLSLLVHVRSRARMALIAGLFVLVSGLVYFVFMAAWLNVFSLIGYIRGVQVALAGVAVGIGAVNLKDALFPGGSLSLSIRESRRPALFRRMREVVQADNLPGALAGVAVLAVMVNFVELLCTAGLPALYTQVLAQQPLSNAGHYGYLALYNLAYIVDDALMVAIAVITLSQLRLQQKQGRVLKILSGAVIAALGIMLLFTPDWLV